jgi:DNA-binding MarR family transcriptional regulator
MLRDRSTVNLEPGLLLQPFVVSQLVAAVIERVVDGSDVTPAEYAVTSSVHALGTVSPTALARALGLSPTTLSAIVDRLVRKNELRRVPNPADGRSYLLELSEKGAATDARNAKRLAVELAALRARLDDPPEEILEALRRLESALRQTLAEG